MKRSVIRVGRTAYPVYSLNTLVVGSGAAGLNAAVRLNQFGQTDVAVVTDRFGAGTSANSGSDKQTYYKLSLAGDRPDSAFDMARDLAAGGSMHGDIALAEAQGSLEAFFHLVGLGVPFPHDRFGAYVGYKTDHDPGQRATSAGPLTSRLMFRALAAEVRRRKVRVFDRHEVIALLTEGAGAAKRAIGAVALDKKKLSSANFGFVLFNATNVVMATGGPGGMYEHSVYPESQTGSHGLLFEAGAAAQNLTESQYGLASVKYRWNVSGTYQQVVPRYISTVAGGGGEREFLNDFFPDMGSLATAVFLKGYQWPFDPRKAADGGASLIDILVYEETVVKGRRVFLDFRRNPDGGGKLEPFEPRLLAPEAKAYLERSGALQATPIARLLKMNRPAADLYRSHGIDLFREPLEVAVCAQHNNGGFRGSIWWQSNVRGLFPIGEVCGTHGVTRPGGSALNAGQVGSARAALFIAHRRVGRPMPVTAFVRAARAQVLAKSEQARAMIGRKDGRALSPESCLAELRRRMSACGAAVRDPEEVRTAKTAARDLWLRARREVRVPSGRDLPKAFKALDLALTHAVYLEAVSEYLDRGGKSRGSTLVPDPSGRKPHPLLGDRWAFSLAEPPDFVSGNILEVWLDKKGRVRKRWVPVRPVPPAEGWFETVWNDFMKDGIIVEGRAFGSPLARDLYARASTAKTDPRAKPGAPVAVVTGAGQGIGRGIVLALAHEGFDVAGIDIVFDPRNRKKGLFEVKRKVEKLGRRFLPIEGDIARLEDHDRMLDAAFGEFGAIDVLVNNAGIAPAKRVDILETAPESYDRLLGVNARGPFFLTQNAARRMATRNDTRPGLPPSIIFITSISAVVSSASRAEYCVSKAALSMTAALFADALAAKGINVYEVRPGIISTDMTAGVKDKYDRLIAGGLVPQGRWGRPEDVGRTVAALARGDLGFSTGAVVEVSGGLNIRRL